MDSEDLYWVLGGLFLPIAMAFYSGVIIKRHEKTIMAFYWALREKYTHSYVTPNKVVNFVRKCCRMKAENSIHWVVCIFHYLQIVMVTSPIFMLLLPIFIPLEKAIGICYIIGLGPYGVIAFMDGAFLILQVHRCKRIKKTNPKYAKREFYDWRG